MKEFDELGAEIARLRVQQQMTQKQLADLAGMGQSTLARFEKAGVAEFGSAKLLRLLSVLGYEISFVPTKRVFTLQDALAAKSQNQER
ncbi:MAG: helix-turn-helix domain-containing protein [Gammaproteobacteria bacterium]|nr:helix-turn-helix domain-containing protein [Gammaproteobacteria bacterium]MBU0847938.1 helix-turn-helix domain-containing protein [Gammaproteobacteria bacterium]MBU1268942.1 helix-turn-helix domain-containing protein [Gammaproteobacteria bacterium]MBU1529724.1 helix-turn-helix domain-containing protein [Gammaproteobacteria bacterium]MBU1780025.1 helix-turn-helix domain-containing protein [Gammaproteobacteria bacterium]